MRCARIRLTASLLGLCLAVPSLSSPAELTEPTAAAFQRYVEHTEARMQGEFTDPAHFLFFDSLPEKRRQTILSRVHNGIVVIEPLRTSNGGKEIEIPDGMVHHWVAVAFIPGVTRDQAIALAQNYARHAQLYSPDVQQARVLARSGDHFSVYFRFYRKAIVTAVYNTEFGVDYFFPDASRAYSIGRSVRVAELENPGKANEREMTVGNDHGYMWRLNLYTRYLEKDGGVYIQIEFLALSRSVPAIFAWLVNPYIRSIPREYLTHYVATTRSALSSDARASSLGPRPGADARRPAP